MVDDYRTLFGLKEESQLFPALRCLLLKKRIANKRPCPCGCGKPLANVGSMIGSGISGMYFPGLGSGTICWESSRPFGPPP
jgi:hypothetical protein